MDDNDDYCAVSTRVDGKKHSWKFDGDDPYIICFFCGEIRDALSGKVLPKTTPSTHKESWEDQASKIISRAYHLGAGNYPEEANIKNGTTETLALISQAISLEKERLIQRLEKEKTFLTNNAANNWNGAIDKCLQLIREE